jgi:hypothetical protein
MILTFVFTFLLTFGCASQSSQMNGKAESASEQRVGSKSNVTTGQEFARTDQVFGASHWSDTHSQADLEKMFRPTKKGQSLKMPVAAKVVSDRQMEKLFALTKANSLVGAGKNRGYGSRAPASVVTPEILWQNTNGQAAIWEIGGFSIGAAAAVGPNPGTSWQIVGTGDFNGDGNLDILWQNTSGQAAIWLMNGTTIIGAAVVGPNPGTSWQIVGVGDFNGDGKADILWQNTSGQAAIWLMNGLSIVGASVVGPNPGTSWQIVGRKNHFLASVQNNIPIIYGCTDTSANNYDPSATADNGSCTYTIYGCTDPNANDYDPSANVDNGSCTYTVYGCTDPTADNYDPSANTDNGSCTYTVYGCTDPTADNYDPSANTDDGSCTYSN